MQTKGSLGRRSVRLIAVPLILVSAAALLIEFDLLPWRKAWVVPPLIAIYVGIELLISAIKKQKEE